MLKRLLLDLALGSERVSDPHLVGEQRRPFRGDWLRFRALFASRSGIALLIF